MKSSHPVFARSCACQVTLGGALGEFLESAGVFDFVAGDQFLPGRAEEEMHLIVILRLDGGEHRIHRLLIAVE